MKKYPLPAKEQRKTFMQEFKSKMKEDQFLLQLSKEVTALASCFPVPGITN